MNIADVVEPMPRPLSGREREWLWWVLPDERPGYAALRRRLSSMQVVAIGRRGEGHLIVAEPGTVPDHSAPLASVVAFGEFEGPVGRGSVTVREEVAGQIDVELVDAPEPHERRWTYSRWTPGEPCPQCGGLVRTVAIRTASGSSVTLAVCAVDRRIWVHASATEICRPIPITLFYSELMRRSGIRDPKQALRSERLFEALSTFSDDALAVAFISYNQVRSKVSDDDPLRPPAPRRPFWRRWLTLNRS